MAARWCTVFDLKDASPLFSLCTNDDSHSNTPCRNLLSCNRERRRCALCVSSTNNTCSCNLLSLRCLFTEMLVQCSPFPVGSVCVWCFCTAKPLSALCIYLGNQFSYVRPRGFKSASSTVRSLLYVHQLHLMSPAFDIPHHNGVISAEGAKCQIEALTNVALMKITVTVMLTSSLLVLQCRRSTGLRRLP